MRRRWFVVLGAIALALLAGRAVAAWYADALWFASLGASSLWRERSWLTLLMRGGSGLAAGAFVFANLYAVRTNVISLVLPRRIGNLEIGEEVPGRHLVIAAALVAALFGWMLALPAESWQQLALLRHGVRFGESDPYFDADLGFFVYRLPFEQTVFIETVVTVILATVIVLFCYSLTPSLRRDRSRVYVSQHARRHLVVLVAILLALLGWSFRLDVYRPMFAGHGVDGAFDFIDHRVGVPVSLALGVVSCVAAGSFLLFGWVGQLRGALLALVIMATLGAGISIVTPIVVRRGVMAAEVGARDQSYLLTRAAYSRRAYGLDLVARGDSALHFPDPRAAAGAVSSWDPFVLLRSASFWRPPDLPAGLGWISSRSTLYAVLPLRPAAPRDDSAPRRWTLERALAAGVQAGREPMRFADSTGSVAGTFLGDPPLVYDGAPAGLRVIADTLDRIPAPLLASWSARVAFAWSRQHLSLAGGDLPSPRPRAIVRRDIRERVAALAPFFAQGSVVTPLAAEDSLFWAIDLYATSASYPFSQRDSIGDSEVRYLRHAATAIVNGGTGRVVLLRDPVLDPIAETWTRLFPDLFADSEAVPHAVLALLPPEADGARSQARLLARYGLRGEMPPAGRLPRSPVDSLPPSEREELFALPRGDAVAWSAAVVDASDHVTGLVVATGGAHRVAHWIPLARPGERWSSIGGSLRRALDDSVAAAARTRIVHGAIRAIPVGRGIAFTQSTYAMPGDAPPELLRVAVRFGEVVTTGRTVSQALGGPAPAPPGADQAAGDDFRRRVRALYAEMRSAMRRGDWPAFGRAYDALGRLLDTRSEPTPQP